MCGIVGFAWKDPQRAVDAGLLDGMCRLLWHRGPDDGGLYTRGNVGLGHRRLAILDLSAAGRQPMVSRDGRFVVVFNGEIYNYLELRRELHSCGKAHGSQPEGFVTETDTEVLLEAYRRWGQDCVRRFNGMWAFAVYDTQAETLFLSRDRVGIKPLYYLQDGESFVFASEIKAILGVKPEQRRPDRAYLANFLRSGLRDFGPRTAFENVRAIPPAHIALYDVRTGTLDVRRYWQIDPGRAGTVSVEDAPRRLHELLQSSIELHLRSDVPVGTCLSGGIDSSTIVGMTAAQIGGPVYTFSGLYDDDGCNERRYVDAVNRHVRTRSRPVRPQPCGDLLHDLRRIVWHQDEPAGSPGLYTQYHVMRAARRDVTVVLDGQGGDELFAGYLFDFTARVRDLIRADPLTGRWQALRLLLSVWKHWGLLTAAEGWNALFGGALDVLKRFVPRPRSADWNIVSEEWMRDSGDRRFPPIAIPSLGSHLDDSLHRQVAATSLPTLLHYEDRNSMAFSLEARVPLLDYRIVEFAFSLLPRAKINGSWTKWALRTVAERYVPHEVAWRRSKMGYPTPFDRWLRQPEDREEIDAALFSPQALDRGVFDGARLRRLWDEQQQGADHGWLLFRVLTTHLWFEQAIEGWQPAPAVAPASVFTPRIAAAA